MESRFAFRLTGRRRIVVRMPKARRPNPRTTSIKLKRRRRTLPPGVWRTAASLPETNWRLSAVRSIGMGEGIPVSIELKMRFLIPATTPRPHGVRDRQLGSCEARGPLLSLPQMERLTRRRPAGDRFLLRRPRAKSTPQYGKHPRPATSTPGPRNAIPAPAGRIQVEGSAVKPTRRALPRTGSLLPEKQEPCAAMPVALSGHLAPLPPKVTPRRAAPSVDTGPI